MWQFDGGYVDLDDNGSPTGWNYYVTDHLGSTRKVVGSDNTVRETISYYPFGSEMTMQDPAQMSSDFQHPYRFTGKELDRLNGLNMYDFGARWFDVAGVPMWTSIDPLAEKYYNVSPYAYCQNNPIMFVDPTGKEGIKYIDEDGNKVIESNVVVLLEKKRAIPSNADNKTIQRLTRLNNKIENRNNQRIQTIREQLDETYSDAVDSNGNHVSFKFNILGIETENPNLNKVSQSMNIAIQNGLPAITTDKIEGATGYGIAAAAVLSQASAGSSLGVASGGLIRLNDRSATTLAHEIGHTLGLTDSYGHGNGHGEGIMGSPPTTLLPSEVDKIWEKAYERKK
jgi:RHS repeat-associated protein